MSDSSATEGDAERLSPDDAFALLGNETRIAILQALWEAHEPFKDSAVPFSDLRERVGARDSGRFNYHLDELVGHFVERTDEGYELRPRGRKFARVVVAGTAVEDPAFGPSEVDRECPFCGAATTVSYEEEQLRHACTECDGWPGHPDAFPDGTLSVHRFMPAGLTDRDPEEILAAERIQAKHERAMMVEGVCPECSGPVDPDPAVCEDHDPDGVCENCGARSPVRVSYTCAVCKHAWMLGPKLTVVTHPAVVGFYHEHDVEFDVGDPAESRIEGWEEELVSRDPLTVRLTIPVADAELRLTLDEEMNVVDRAVR